MTEIKSVERRGEGSGRRASKADPDHVLKLRRARRRLAHRTSLFGVLIAAVSAIVITACAAEPGTGADAFPIHVDPDTGVEFVSIDRFSDEAGTILRRSDSPDLPAPNEPIDFDADFLSQALGPVGQDVKYYNFDVAPLASAPVYSFVYASDPTRRVDGQPAVFDVIPGEEGYNDFWQVVNVLVPDDFEPNSVHSFDDIKLAGFETERTGTIINCPIVPYGSTAALATRNATGWYRGMSVKYFVFDKTESSVVNPGRLDVPYSVVRVIFEGNDPARGMKTEPDTGNTHNVFETVPGDKLYRSLWRHDFVDEAGFDSVSDWESSKAAGEADIDMDHILVNCPVVIWPGSQEN